MHDSLGDLPCHDHAHDLLALEAADHAPHPGDSGPVEALHQSGQLRLRFVADAHANDADAELPGLLGHQERETAASGQEAEPLAGVSHPRAPGAA